eukprot:TRINITY_DN1864_c0_g2_i1.p3 TRINITY_DN1864_c0_g2~~TRINITY_DN1864_c0_g2_i1.p3  ORF type:complete len:114 (-),score=12.68 TRINITY_DN1864_c0_g2_i1:330-671(-)
MKYFQSSEEQISKTKVQVFLQQQNLIAMYYPKFFFSVNKLHPNCTIECTQLTPEVKIDIIILFCVYEFRQLYLNKQLTIGILLAVFSSTNSNDDQWNSDGEDDDQWNGDDEEW